MSELDQTLSGILREFQSESKERLNAEFLDFWNTLGESEKEQYSGILVSRAEMILPNRSGSDIEELLPWNLKPTTDEKSTLLSTWFPPSIDLKSFMRECIRWKVVTSQTVIEDRIIIGSRRTQIHKFVDMMLERHKPDEIAGSNTSEKVLSEMINEGHFSQFEYGLILPNLYQVEISETKCILISGWPYKILEKGEFIDLEFNEGGQYLSSLSEQLSQITPTDYTKGLDPLKQLSRSPEHYLDMHIQIVETNDDSATGPLLREIVPVPGKQVVEHPPQFMMKSITWKTEKYEFFVTKSTTHEGMYYPPRLWTNSNPTLVGLECGGWKNSPLSFGSLKQLQLAFYAIEGNRQTLSDCSIKTMEMVRFSMLRRNVEVSESLVSEFCKHNWLRV